MTERLVIRSVRSLARSVDDLSHNPAVYGALLRDGDRTLADWGYYDRNTRRAFQIAGHTLIYIGSAPTRGLRRRLCDHIRGDSRRSSFRRTLGVLLAPEMALTAHCTSGKSYFHFGDGEATISAWMEDRMLFAFRESTDPVDEERLLIRRYNPALNIKEQENRLFSQRLKAMRQLVVQGLLSVPTTSRR